MRCLIWFCVMATAMMGLAGSAGAEVIYLTTFDGAPLGDVQDPYQFTLGERYPLLNHTAAVPRSFNSPDGPTIVDAETLLANPLQGGNAMLVESGGQSEGLLFDFVDAYPPGDVTIEFMWMANDLAPAGNLFEFIYLGSNEWPFGGTFSWSFRMATGQPMNFRVFDGAIETHIDVLTPPVTNTWYHYVGVLDYNESSPANSELRFYVDDVLQGTISPYNASAHIWSIGGSNSIYDHSLCIGYSLGQDANQGDNRGMDGAIDAFAISTDALTPGSFALPPVIPVVTGVSDWSIYR